LDEIIETGKKQALTPHLDLPFWCIG